MHYNTTISSTLKPTPTPTPPAPTPIPINLVKTNTNKISKLLSNVINKGNNQTLSVNNQSMSRHQKKLAKYLLFNKDHQNNFSKQWGNPAGCFPKIILVAGDPNKYPTGTTPFYNKDMKYNPTKDKWWNVAANSNQLFVFTNNPFHPNNSYQPENEITPDNVPHFYEIIEYKDSNSGNFYYKSEIVKDKIFWFNYTKGSKNGVQIYWSAKMQPANSNFIGKLLGYESGEFFGQTHCMQCCKAKGNHKTSTINWKNFDDFAYVTTLNGDYNIDNCNSANKKSITYDNGKGLCKF